MHPNSAIDRSEVGEREWSDGAPSYFLRIIMKQGQVIETGSSASRDDVAGVKARIEAFIAGRLGSPAESGTGASK